MNILVCGYYVNYDWPLYILSHYSSSTNYRHDEINGDSHQQACLRLTQVQYRVLYEYFY